MTARVSIHGRLGADPGEHETKDGDVYCRLRVGVTVWDRSEQSEETNWYTTFVYGDRAEACLKHLGKGDEVNVHGKLVASLDNRDEIDLMITQPDVDFCGGKGKGRDRDDDEDEPKRRSKGRSKSKERDDDRGRGRSGPRKSRGRETRRNDDRREENDGFDD